MKKGRNRDDKKRSFLRSVCVFHGSTNHFKIHPSYPLILCLYSYLVLSAPITVSVNLHFPVRRSGGPHY
jgi:hypothetical protein